MQDRKGTKDPHSKLTSAADTLAEMALLKNPDEDRGKQMNLGKLRSGGAHGRQGRSGNRAFEMPAGRCHYAFHFIGMERLR